MSEAVECAGVGEVSHHGAGRAIGHGPSRSDAGAAIGVGAPHLGATLDPSVQALVDREVRLLDRHGQGLVVHDREGVLVQANARAISRGGLRWNGRRLVLADGWAVVGRDGEVVADDDLPNALVQRMGRAVHRVDLGLRDPVGRVSWHAVTASPVKAEDGETVAVVTTLGTLDGGDVDAVGASRSVSLAVLACDDQGRVTYVSPEAEVLYGCRSAEASGRRAADVVTWELPPGRIAQLVAGGGQGERWSGDIWIRRPDSGCTLARLTIAPITTPGAASVVVTVAVALPAPEDTAVEGSLAPARDELTGLLTRHRFLETLERRFAAHHRGDAPIILAILHLEDLRIINDSMDSGTGDHVIRSAARALADAMHVGDTAGRLSGTTFAVCFQAVPSTDVDEYVARLRRAIALPIAVGEDQIVLRCSAGFAAASSGGSPATAEGLLQSADLALARTRAIARDASLVYEDGLRHRMQTDHRIEAAIRSALASGTVTLGYQPIVRLADARVVEVEALLRLTDDEGLLPAGEVIAVAEHRGLIGDLGLLILETACREAAVWRHAGGEEPIGVCVNVSAAQLDDPHLDAKVGRVLIETGFDPADLNLEMTETVLMNDSTWSAGQLTKLKRLGVRLSADDFGTGYSSLAYLKRFPLDVIKADLSFVAGLPSSVEDHAVVRAIIGLAEVLGLSVVAEGVEGPAQLDALRALGCGFGQGYLWSRAVPADRVRGIADEVHRAGHRAGPAPSSATPDAPMAAPVLRERPDPCRGAHGALRRWASQLVACCEGSAPSASDLADLVERSGRLVSDLDLLSSVDDGTLEVSLAVTDLLPVVEAAARGAARDGVVRVEPLIVGTPRAWCDGVLVERAVRALVDNAIQHAGADGPPLVLVGRRGRWMDISVHDRGPGVAASQLPQAFARYGRPDGGPGVGIGLTVARELARALGGEVVHRAPGDGVGSVFTLRLPAASDGTGEQVVSASASGRSQ